MLVFSTAFVGVTHQHPTVTARHEAVSRNECLYCLEIASFLAMTGEKAQPGGQ